MTKMQQHIAMSITAYMLDIIRILYTCSCVGAKKQEESRKQAPRGPS